MRSGLRLVALLLALGTGTSVAATYRGTVVSIEGNVARVAMSGDVRPPVGAKAEIYFKMAGFDDEIAVATGSALKIDKGDLLVKIEEASGTVEKGHLVRFGPAESVTAAAPSPASTASIVGMWAGLEPGGDKISFAFREDGTVSYVRLKGKKKNILRGKYRTDCAATPCRLELFAFEVNGARAKGETIAGLFELHDIDMRFDLSNELQRNPGNGFTSGAITLIRSPAETPGANTSKDAPESHPPPPPPQASPTVTRSSFAGQWKVQNENASYTLSLRQEGDRVTGDYDLYGGTLSGTVRNGVLRASWRQSGNKRGGSATLRLSADGETLSGPWEYDPATFSSGLRGTGTWTFKRISASR
ncbi:MAG TPA: hypothetical protein VM940_07150 [Chthoniobacterales bacterium]|nr:hypothetical protein [Chthoniobacterales bacterium]